MKVNHFKEQGGFGRSIGLQVRFDYRLPNWVRAARFYKSAVRVVLDYGNSQREVEIYFRKIDRSRK